VDVALMNDAGWVLGLLCCKGLIEPLNQEKAIFCGKALLGSPHPNHVYEGAGILLVITNSNEDPIIEMVATD
jgi:hypothetical protein